MTRRTNQGKPNGHAGPNGRINGSGDPERVGVNGHGLASAGRDGIPAPACAGGPRDHAASDDASGEAVANVASFATAAGTDHQACAEVAPSLPNGAERYSPQTTPAVSNSGKEEKEVPPGDHPLPADPAEFVEEIHQKIDLTELWRNLLRSTDEKIKQRAVEKLTDMRYKGASSLADEPAQVVIDIDSAVARRAAEGAMK
jgi:hypothetical protein